MKQPNNLEIILFTNTSFAKRELCEKNDEVNKERLSLKDELEKTCWSGLLTEMLPDIFGNGQKLFIWKVNQAGQFIRVVMADAPPSLQYENSIDPHFFLEIFMLYN
jgi:hypothetical protein